MFNALRNQEDGVGKIHGKVGPHEQDDAVKGGLGLALVHGLDPLGDSEHWISNHDQRKDVGSQGPQGQLQGHDVLKPQGHRRSPNARLGGLGADVDVDGGRHSKQS